MGDEDINICCWLVSAPSFPCELAPWTETKPLLLACAFESPAWTAVYLQATVPFNHNTAFMSLLCSGIHFVASSKPFFYSVVLCAKLSHCSSLSTPPSWFFHLRSNPHSWAGGCVVWTLLNESFWTSITAPNTLLMNMYMLSDCSQTIKEDCSASQQLLPSWIPAFIYNYTQKWVVSEQPSLTN